jgi:diphthamide biosynthesis protein 3
MNPEDLALAIHHTPYSIQQQIGGHNIERQILYCCNHLHFHFQMSNVYDEIEIEDMAFDLEFEVYTYPCPCGDKFSISLEELLDGEEIATCPSCTLRIRIIFDDDKLPASALPLPEADFEDKPE